MGELNGEIFPKNASPEERQIKTDNVKQKTQVELGKLDNCVSERDDIRSSIILKELFGGEKREKGKMLYSEKLGYLDGGHMYLFFGFYLRAYEAIIEAINKGEKNCIVPFEIIKKGRAFLKLSVKIDLPNNVNDLSQDDIFDVIRETMMCIGLVYENYTKIGPKAVVNRLFNFTNKIKYTIDPSTYSTEDLPSNGMGMLLAEEYIKENKLECKPNLREEFKRVILPHVGNVLLSGNPSIPRESMGNESFLPVITSSEYDLKNPVIKYLSVLDKNHRKFEDFDADKISGKAGKLPWEINITEKKSVPLEILRSVVGLD